MIHVLTEIIICMVVNLSAYCFIQTLMPTATAQSTRSELIALNTLSRIPLILNTMMNHQRVMRKIELMIEKKQNKSKSTKWTIVKSMTTTTRK